MAENLRRDARARAAAWPAEPATALRRMEMTREGGGAWHHVVVRREETTEDGRRRTEDGGRKTEDGRRRTEDGRRRTEDGRRKTEDGRRKTEDGRVARCPRRAISRPAARQPCRSGGAWTSAAAAAAAAVVAREGDRAELGRSIPLRCATHAQATALLDDSIPRRHRDIYITHHTRLRCTIRTRMRPRSSAQRRAARGSETPRRPRLQRRPMRCASRNSSHAAVTHEVGDLLIRHAATRDNRRRLADLVRAPFHSIPFHSLDRVSPT